MTSRSVTRQLAVGVATGAMMIAATSIASAQGNGTVSGVVNDASGQPVSGAFVKLKNDERRLTFMVISKDRGTFDAKDLPPGTYRVQGVGGNFQSGWFENVKVTGCAGGDAKVGLSLNQQRGPDLAPSWPHRKSTTSPGESRRSPDGSRSVGSPARTMPISSSALCQ